MNRSSLQRINYIFYALIFAGVGYYSSFYLITDPGSNSFYKVTLAYFIITAGFIFIHLRTLPLWFYIYIGLVYIATIMASIEILKFS
ncbi:MAG: hypothetical protein JJT78_16670 [Leptospira sp.]|nr:hypothetical protein [Leptospira sp.]